LLDRDLCLADADVDTGRMRDWRRLDVAEILPRLRIIDSEQEATHDLAHLVAPFTCVIRRAGVGRRRRRELRLPAVGARRLENFSGTGCTGRRAADLEPALIGAAVVLAGLPRPRVEDFEAALATTAGGEDR